MFTKVPSYLIQKQKLQYLQQSVTIEKILKSTIRNTRIPKSHEIPPLWKFTRVSSIFEHPLRSYVQTFAQLQRHGRPSADDVGQTANVPVDATATRRLPHDPGEERQENVDDRSTRFRDERERAKRLHNRARRLQPYVQHVQLGGEEFQLLRDRRRGGQQVLNACIQGKWYNMLAK